MIEFILNDKAINTGLPEGTVLLDFIRYHQHLTGTKIGCREGDCGACTILVGELVNDILHYESMTSCLMPLGNAAGKHIVTIEGINHPAGLNPVQQAMADEGATQCGFCTPGFIMSLAGFCLQDDTTNAVAAVDGNICRCTGYKSIERAAAGINRLMKEKKEEETIAFVVEKKIVPEYFTGIKKRLEALRGAIKANGQPDPAALKERPHVVGGGTDLYVQKHDEMTGAGIHFLFDKPEMNGIGKKDNQCFIGPSATVSDLKASPVINEIFPSFQRYAKLVSSTPIRNMATVAGNFINASPIGDFTIFFLALNAQLELSDGNNSRELSLRKLYKGYKQLDKKPEEVIHKIWFNIPDSFYFNFEKVSKRTHLDIASVNTAILLEMNGEQMVKAGLSAGGVGPVPAYLQKTSDYLQGKNVTEETIDGAIEIMKREISPISDTRGSKEYKTLLLEQLIKAHFMELFPEMTTEKMVK